MSPVLGFSPVGSGVGGGVQSSLEPQSPSRQGNPPAQPTVPSLHAVCAPPGPPFSSPQGSASQSRLPLDEPESPGSGLELGFRAVRGPAQSEFYLLSARERPPGTPPPSSLAPSSPHTASPYLGLFQLLRAPSGFLLASRCRISSQSTFL
uniref:Uncharacterized protein n=1 Tax=Pipistrellus kuhlii TaxID=59472 RepID=A0A7J7YWZ3_PIPKU|nr:hypothetical protein mPipKuh1_009913 [Pipistrellus kuhlii]